MFLVSLSFIELVSFIENIVETFKAAENGNFTQIFLVLLLFIIPSIAAGICVFLIKIGPKKDKSNDKRH